MSLNIGLTAIIETEVVDENITHNVSRMWHEAGIYDALYNSAGQKAKDVIPTLEKGLELMIDNPATYKSLEISKDWGTYEQALAWLTNLIEEFKEYPEGIIKVSK